MACTPFGNGAQSRDRYRFIDGTVETACAFRVRRLEVYGNPSILFVPICVAARNCRSEPACSTCRAWGGTTVLSPGRPGDAMHNGDDASDALPVRLALL